MWCIESERERESKNSVSFADVCAGAKHYFDDGHKVMVTNWNGYAPRKDDTYNIMYFVKARGGSVHTGICTKVDSCIPSLGYGWVAKSQIPKNPNDYKRHKLIIGQAFTAGSDQVIDIPQYIGNNSICSQSYIPIFSPNDTEEECLNICKYMKTKFFRYLVRILKSGQIISNSIFKLVPMQDFGLDSDIDWTQSISDIDKQLYKKYNLTQSEIDYIEKTIKTMS